MTCGLRPLPPTSASDNPTQPPSARPPEPWAHTSAASSPSAGITGRTRDRQTTCARSSPATRAAPPQWAPTACAATSSPPWAMPTSTTERARRSAFWTRSGCTGTRTSTPAHAYPRLGHGQLLGLDDFHRFLFSADLHPPLPRPRVHHDMFRPLSHYYVCTSHNSYLTGNQLSSDCSDVPIIKALQRSVRVIELDMWPNSAKDDIIILHGRLLSDPLICCYLEYILHNIVVLHAIWMLFPTSIRPSLGWTLSSPMPAMMENSKQISIAPSDS
ncbi:uncharacterized protein LOC123440018 [Hordeum vulgare subsp. vulgare]|uniref:uncharacterized protein LOC123440018 n=1 Tax=Hordeum vulgare subsp. vulgare TaxID=112509 RepID=UPI001D1A424B|nr:uncharacterized protein LOC123440018 [Hordeum vulgare subsp. vulgare]